MTDNAKSIDINNLIEECRGYKMTPEEQEKQRRSFAYGNTVIENPNITRELIDKAAEDLKRTE